MKEDRRAAARHRLRMRQALAIYHWAKSPIVSFMEVEASGGIILMVSMVVALVWANSPWAQSYHDVWHAHFTVTLGSVHLDLSVAHWINDGLMAVFFFLVGMEIKRELVSGELSSSRQAALPIMAAVGGMVVPALIFFALNPSGPEARGWGIPMATDIAFALGVLALLGSRVPLGLKIFLTALAIVDDLGAVLVISIFYTSDVSLVHLGLGLSLVTGLFALNVWGVRQVWIYLLVGVVVWFLFFRSGVHATVAGVLVAATIPHQVLYDRNRFIRRIRTATSLLEEQEGIDKDLEKEQREVAMQIIHEASERWGSPLHRLEHDLAPWVSFVIMPLFALANAGVHLEWSALGSALASPVPLGILLGLFVGKQIGVFGFAWLSVKLGLANLPAGSDWRRLYSVAVLAGIGFTMSLFIANLAFSTPEMLDLAKVGILAASLLSGIVGALAMLSAPKKPVVSDSLEPAAEIS